MSDVFLALKHWAKSGPAEDFWFWTLGLLITALVSFSVCFISLHRKRIIEDTPTSKIRSAAQGYVELNGYGQLMEGQPIVAPLTGTICTWYKYRVDEHRRSGKNSKWVTIRSGTSEELFLIKDDTGQCIIDPEDAHVTVTNKDVWHGAEANPVGGVSTINKEPALFSGFGRHRRYRYTEERLHTDESLYAIGLYKTVGGAGAKFNINEDVRELIREWKADSETLMKKFDADNNGAIDLQEWQNVRQAAYDHIVEMHGEQKALPPVNIMNKTNDSRRPFILSAIEENNLVYRLHIYSILSLSLFILCGSLSTWLLGMRLAA